MRLLPAAILTFTLFYSMNAFAVKKADSSLRKFSLIPAPKKIELLSGRGITYNTLKAIHLKGIAKMPLLYGPLKTLPVSRKSGEGIITLNLSDDESLPNSTEGYILKIKNGHVVINARSQAGLFYGCMTLLQLLVDSRDQQIKIPSCEITDYPAYNWRGYMVDVGRNYQSVKQLKQQIDIMARYKLNVFHFHLTEHIAWRLQVKRYPQLTAPENMLRDKGRYYSIPEMKDLIQYCRDRFITLVPEIDMPGHSNAFTRAMGMDMQSDSGLHIMKNVIREVCTTYDIPYIHIGADEVAIRNKQFLPEITDLIHQYGKQTIAWNPGGNYGDNTIHQIWKDENRKKSIKYIDSRALYLSDMAPESSVVSIFERQIGEKTHGDSNLLGGEICLWDDRRMTNETDHLTMNAVYPDMLAFGERSWRGGGYPGTVLDIGPDSSARAKAFAAFEKKLIDHKRKYFKQLPFPYVKQTHLHWKLFGPFENHGELAAKFWPESPNVSPADSIAAIHATGGTIWLWYHNGASYNTWLSSPHVNTTWYASTAFWSDTDTTITLWIGFKNLLRSLASATPPTGQWDYNKSKIWLNDKTIPPPEWKYPGRKLSENLEEPLVDEGYYYRPPAKVSITKGWNHILVKLPLTMSGQLAPWQRRCMFTVMPVHREEGINWYANETEFTYPTEKKDSFSQSFKLLPTPQKTELRSGEGITYNTLRAIHLRGKAAKHHPHHWANTALNADWMHLIGLKMNDDISKWISGMASLRAD